MNKEPMTFSLVDVLNMTVHLQKIMKIVPMQSLALKVFRYSWIFENVTI